MLMTRPIHSLGDNIGRYRLIGEIARGGMGIVYIAAAHGPAGFSKLVALKELRPDLADDGEFLTMFLEEARMAARLSHPNIVQTNDVSEHEGRHFIAMEYLEGRALYHVLKRFVARGGFPQRLALTILRDALSALDYAHELTGFDGKPLGFVHRDISPHNIFITFEGHTKVIDFGIAKARDSSLETKTGVLKGRANYMAPEQLLRRADRRSDIFSIGAIMFEILSGRRLWQGMGDVEILAALTRGEIPSLTAVRPETTPLLLEVCERALKVRPEERYASAAEMRDALDQYLWATGGAPRPRELSGVLQDFEPERQRTRALIESALQRLNDNAGGQLETLALPDSLDGSLRSRSSSSSPSSPSSSSLFARSLAEHSQIASSQRLRSEASVLRRLPGEPSRNSRMPPVTNEKLIVPALQPVLEPAPLGGTGLLRRRTWIVAGALGAVFVGTTLGVALHHSPAPDAGVPLAPLAPAPAPAARVSELPTPPPTATSLETIVFSVSVSPSSAQVLIDGHAMPSNPFLGRFAKGPGTHRVRAIAPGYQPKERLVTFDDNVMIDLSLSPNHPVTVWHHEPAPVRHVEAPPPIRPQAAPAPAPTPVASSPRTSAPVDISPRGEWEPPRKRTIDTNNPYGEEK
jgi:serine/threonine-protein kinase